MKDIEYGIRKALYLEHPECYVGHYDDDIKWEQLALELFRNMNDPNNAMYWSTQKWKYDEDVNAELNDFVNTPDITFDKILDYAFERCLKYLKCHPVKSNYSNKKYDICGNRGNSKPDQYEFSFFDFVICAQSKLFDKYELEMSYDQDLGYGHYAHREISFSTRYWHIDTNDKNFTITWGPRIVGDKGFHDEMKEKLQNIKDELNRYKKESKYLNTPIIKLLQETEI